MKDFFCYSETRVLSPSSQARGIARDPGQLLTKYLLME